MSVETPFGKPSPGDASEIAPGVWMLSIPVPFPPGFQNAFAFEDEIDGRAAWTIVDPGLAAAEGFWRQALAAELRALPIGRVIATHHHPDHIGCAGWMRRAHGAPLLTTRTAWLYARMLQLDAWDEPPDESIAFYRKLGFSAAMLGRYRDRAKFNFSVLVAPLPLGFHRLIQGDVIDIGSRRFQAQIGNGHAPEHLVLVSETDDLVIAGDQILLTISPNIGVYATEPFADPLGEWLTSCADFSRRLGDERLILPGHGPAFYGAPERLQTILAKHRDRLDALEDYLEEPRRVVDCFEVLFSRRIDGAAEGLAAVEAAAHLNHLEATGRAFRETVDGVDLWRSKQ